MCDSTDPPEPSGDDEPDETDDAYRSPQSGLDRDASHFRDTSAGAHSMTVSCPKCRSPGVETRHHARKAGGAVGTVAGMASGIGIALSGAEIGATVGIIAGPPGAACGAIAGAVIAGLICGAAGCAAGAAFGEAVDAKVLDNYRCLACGYTFSPDPD
jgi:hypothetical protein